MRPLTRDEFACHKRRKLSKIISSCCLIYHAISFTLKACFDGTKNCRLKQGAMMDLLIWSENVESSN